MSHSMYGDPNNSNNKNNNNTIPVTVSYIRSIRERTTTRGCVLQTKRTTQYACIYFNLLFIYAHGKVDNSVAKSHSHTLTQTQNHVQILSSLLPKDTSPLNDAYSPCEAMFMRCRGLYAKNSLFGYDYFHRCVYESILMQSRLTMSHSISCMSSCLCFFSLCILLPRYETIISHNEQHF